MTSTEQLREHLTNRQAFWSAERVAALEVRKLEEVEFHNVDGSAHDNRKWYTVTQPSRRWVSDWLSRECAGKTALDYACGLGGMTHHIARSGAELTVGLDISDGRLQIAREQSIREKLNDRLVFVQGDCEATEFPDASFDRILCSGMLHHLELDRAYTELRRILRPGGKILCVEALAHNPLIQAYRNRTPEMRTEWETQHILRVEDALRATKWFRLGEMKFWHLCDLASVPVRKTPIGPFVRRAGRLVDQVLLRIPGIRRMAWQFTFVLEHPEAR
jgi:SAM-dependent methyltransferase